MKIRTLRVAGVIQRVLASSLQSDVPDADAWKINITRVTISPNLQFAKVFFSSLDGEAGRVVAEECLAKHRGFLKLALARNLRIKYQPEIRFVWDEELQVAEKLDDMFEKIRQDEQEVDK